MNIEEIIENLKEYRLEVIKKLVSKNWQHFKYYFLIREKFLENNIDDQFKKTFCNFYAMNGPMGLNVQQKDKFFKMLLLKESSLEKIIKSLYDVPGYNNSHRLLLSFGTKLLHTLDNNLPIHDSRIAEVLMLPDPIQSSFSLEEKIRNRIYIYAELKGNFDLLLKNAKIISYLDDMRKRLSSASEKDNFEWKDNLISDTKLLDSLLWAL